MQTLVIACCNSLKLEENPIAVLEKLVQDHKLSKPSIIDTTSSNSDLHFTKKRPLLKSNHNKDPENRFKQTTPNKKNPTPIKPVRIRMRESMLNIENKPIILKGKLRKPLDKTNDEEHPRLRETGHTNRSRKKSCYNCDDGNDWIPLDRNTSDKSHKTAAKNTSAAGIEIINGEGKTKGGSIVKAEQNRTGSDTLKNKSLLKDSENADRIPKTKTIRESIMSEKVISDNSFPESTRISTSFNGRRRFTIKQGRPVKLDIKLELKDIDRDSSRLSKRVPRRNEKAKTKIEERSSSDFGFDDFSSSQFGPFNDFGVKFDFPKTTFAETHTKHPKREILLHMPKHKEPAKTKYKVPKDPSVLYVDDPWKNIDKITNASPPYIPKPAQNTGYKPHLFDSAPDYKPYAPKPVYKPDFGYKPVPAYKPEPAYKPALYEPEPSYKPQPISKPVYHYKKPNYRPPIQTKPTIHKPHHIIKTPCKESKPHHEPKPFHKAE